MYKEIYEKLDNNNNNAKEVDVSKNWFEPERKI